MESISNGESSEQRETIDVIMQLPELKIHNFFPHDRHRVLRPSFWPLRLLDLKNWCGIYEYIRHLQLQKITGK